MAIGWAPRIISCLLPLSCTLQCFPDVIDMHMHK